MLGLVVFTEVGLLDRTMDLFQCWLMLCDLMWPAYRLDIANPEYAGLGAFGRFAFLCLAARASSISMDTW